MTIRWRLAALFLQVILLCTVTAVLTGSVVRNEIWFFSGLLAIVVNPQLWEPHYPKNQDVIGNSIMAGALALAAPKQITDPGWTLLLLFLIVVGLSALLGTILGTGKDEGGPSALARGFQILGRVGSAAIIYSSVFWLSAFEYAPPEIDEGKIRLAPSFWLLAATWVTLMLIGRVNWQSIWANVTRAPVPGTPEGMVGPSILLVSSNSLPPSGTIVEVSDERTKAQGVVITRIQRAADAWAEIYIEEPDKCADLLRKPAVTIRPMNEKKRRVIGSVDSGSSDTRLEFVTTEPLTVGQVVTVRERRDILDRAATSDALVAHPVSREVLFQVTSAAVDRSAVKGGTHLIVRARATQLGEFDDETGRLVRHQWVPTPGNAVEQLVPPKIFDNTPESWLLIGKVLGTEVPVFIDLDIAREGHIVILGMTRMGKTTFALRLIEALGQIGPVIVLDQTGEYAGKRGLKKIEEGDEDAPGVSVFEPKPNEVPPDRALKCLQWLLEKASNEYKSGDPMRRVLLLEEAHQFIPEPAGLGFNAPGRDASYAFGLLMMQIRKFGLSVTLISQRTAVVAKSALSQCENVIAFKSVDQTGLDYLESLIGSEARLLLPGLKQGQALVFGPALSADGPVVVEMLNPRRSIP